MKKIVVWSGLLIFMALGTQSFAQFKLAEQAARNSRRISNVVSTQVDASLRSTTFGLRVPVEIASQKLEVEICPIKFPAQINSINFSYVHQYRKILEGADKLSELQVQQAIAYKWILDNKESGKSHVFFTDQNELARSLDSFYEGVGGIAKLSPKKRVKLYELPVDNILYRPAGYRTPVVLKSSEYFVMYDANHKTGQIVKKTPAMLQLFARPCALSTQCPVSLEEQTFSFTDQLNKYYSQKEKHSKSADMVSDEELLKKREEIVERELEEGSRMDFSNVTRQATSEEESALLELNQASNQQILQEVYGRYATNEEIYRLKKWETQSDIAGRQVGELMWKTMQAPKEFSSKMRLGKYLERLHQDSAARVKDSFTGHIYFVYEIPVKGIQYIKNGKTTIDLNPEEFVMLYNSRDDAQIVRRSVIEEGRLYRFVK